MILSHLLEMDFNLTRYIKKLHLLNVNYANHEGILRQARMHYSIEALS
jgi:hypothetical protein